jgi:hypothetical protein
LGQGRELLRERVHSAPVAGRARSESSRLLYVRSFVGMTRTTRGSRSHCSRLSGCVGVCDGRGLRRHGNRRSNSQDGRAQWCRIPNFALLDSFLPYFGALSIYLPVFEDQLHRSWPCAYCGGLGRRLNQASRSLRTIVRTNTLRPTAMTRSDGGSRPKLGR